MRTLKTPQEKKRLSLQRDCRNTYGENSKSSRKNIRRGKQRSHMEERRGGSQSLALIKGNLDEDRIDSSELDARVRMIQSQHAAFRKQPDTPLKEVLERKRVKGRKYLTVAPDRSGAL